MCNLIEGSEVVHRDEATVISTQTRAAGRTGDFHNRKTSSAANDENPTKPTTPAPESLRSDKTVRTLDLNFKLF